VSELLARLPARPRRRSLWLLGAVSVAVLAAAIVLLVMRMEASGSARAGASATASAVRPGHLYGEATWAPGAAMAPAISGLRDQNGRPFSLSALRGHTVAIAFFDSHCHQACPLEGRALAAAEQALPAAERPVLVVVSVNPRDTAASTRAAVGQWGLAAAGRWYWLRGTHAQLARVWRAYRIFVAAPAHGDIAHTEALYLLGRRGDERSGYLYPFATRFVSADLRTLAREREG
jgi:protein SCO1/2